MRVLMPSALLLRYGLAVAAVLLALLLTALLQPLLDRSLFLLFLGSVIISTWYGGVGPALLTIGLSAIACQYFLINPAAMPVVDPSEDLIRLLVFVLVSLLIICPLIAARKRTEQALQEREARERSLLESNIVGVIHSDFEGRILDANNAFLEMVGYTREELRDGKVRWDSLTPAEYRYLSERAMESLRTTGVCPPFEKEYIRKDGVRLPVLLGLALLEGTREQAICFVLDLSERKRAEDALKHMREQLEVRVQEQTAELRRVNDELKSEIDEHKWAEQTLREQAYLLDLTYDPVFVRDSKDVITYWNRGAEELYGWTRKEAVGQVPHQLLRTIFPAPFEEITAEVLRTGRWEGELIHTKRNGMQVVVASRWALKQDEQGRPLAILEINNDVTEQKRAEEALRESQARYRQLIELSQDAIFILDDNATFTMSNPAGCTLLGYTERELVGMSVVNTYLPEERPVVTERLQQLKMEGPLRYERVAVCKDGTTVPIEVSLSPMTHGYVQVVLRDISERKRAEALLSMSQKRQALIFESLPVVMYAAKPTSTYEARWISPNVERVTGFPPTTFLDGAFWSSRLHPEDRVRTLQHFDRLFETGVLATEYRWRVADGSYRWFIDRATRVHDSADKQGEILGLWEDITDRKHLSEALHKSNDSLQAVFHASPLAIIALSSDGSVVVWNEASERLFGWTADEVLGRPTPVIPEDQMDEHRALRDLVIRGGTFTGREVKRQRKDGTIIDVSLSAAPLFRVDGTVWGTMGVLMDISERKRVEQTLHLHGQIIDHTHDGVISTDVDGKILSWNRGAEAVFEYVAKDTIGQHISFLFGIDQWTDMVSHLKPESGTAMAHATEVVVRTKSRREVISHLSLSQLREQGGRICGVIVYALDITDRYHAEAEVKESREQLRAFAARLELVREEERTRIAREIHDELGQAVTGLKLDFAWLRNRLDMPSGILDRPAILMKLQSSYELIDSMHLTVRKIATALRPGVLDELGLVAASEWLAREFRTRTGILYELTAPESITVDPDRATALFRILQELLTNVSLHANASKVRIRLEQTPEAYIMQVEDNGKGITEAEQSGVQSLGILGMRERARQWGGAVTIGGMSGKGTTVSVAIPRPMEAT